MSEQPRTAADTPALGRFVEPVVLTVISNELTDALGSNPLPLTKSFALDDDGTLVKTTAAQLTQGRATQQSVASFAEFETLLNSLETHQALAYGVTGQLDVKIVTKKELHKHTNAIARDRHHFRFRQAPAIWFNDYDPANGATPRSADELRERLIEAFPALAEAPMIAQASASSFIYKADTERRGARGWHIYIAARDGSDIPRAGKMLYERLWLNGHGRFAVSKSGQRLDHNLIDNSVWQPERLDFAAGAVCALPLVQRRPPIKMWNVGAPLFDTRRIAEPTHEEEEIIAQKRAIAREAVKAESERMRAQYTAARRKELVEHGISDADASTTINEALDRDILLGDFPLTTAAGERVSVAEVLANRSKYHSACFADPIEPDYRGDNRIAYANLFSGGRSYLYSHAHGGRRFELYPQTKVLKLQRGELPRQADAVLDLTRLAGDVFDQPVGGGRYRLVYTRHGHIIAATDQWLRTYIGRLVRCERFDKRAKKGEEWQPADVPKDLVEAIQSNTTDRRLPVLEAVISAPVMRPDGSIFDAPGYSERDHLLLESDELDSPRVPDAPTDEQVRAAFAVLWYPFKEFPFVDDYARGVKLAALFTVVIRPTLPTAPGFIFDAPEKGTGKTKLAECVSWLAGVVPPIETPPTSDEETHKTLFARVREGAKIILWDNVTHTVYGHASLSAFLTGPQFSGRVLCESRTETLPNHATLLLTGNNVQVQGDVTRRFLTCRINAGVQHPSMRPFDLEPVSWVRDRRREMHIAALTILRGFFARGAPRQTSTTAGSFEDWDRVVRQCVIWLGRSGLAGVGLGDPYATAVSNMETDEDSKTLIDLLHAWHAVFGETPAAARDALLQAGWDDTPVRQALDQAISAIRGDDRTFNARRFGRWLRQNHDRIAGDLKLVAKHDPGSNSSVYAVIELTAQPAAAAQPAPPVNAENDFADLLGEIPEPVPGG